MSSVVRLGILICYLILALGAPVLVVLFPGAPPFQPDREMLQVTRGGFSQPKSALGEGASKYQFNVLNDFPARLAGVAADYPDGSSALISRFVNQAATKVAAEKLMAMIPHQKQSQDLWASHFQTDSGDFVVVAIVGDLVVLVMADAEDKAASRFEGLPALGYNSTPGLGAVLLQQSQGLLMGVLMFYLAIQFLLIRLMIKWLQTRSQPNA
jgi:hypothetical protein